MTNVEELRVSESEQFRLHVLDRLFRKAKNGATVDDLVKTDERLSAVTVEELQNVLNHLVAEKCVSAEEVADRGKIYRPLVFATLAELIRAKASLRDHE
jgi:hypothetical protein